MAKKRNPMLIILSGVALFNVLFCPLYDTWGGLFPRDVDTNFIEAMKCFFTDSDSLRQWAVMFTVAVFFPTLCMLPFAIAGKDRAVMISSSVGVGLWVFVIISYVNDKGADVLFDFENGSVSFGMWVALGLFVASMCVAITCQKQDRSNAVRPQSTVPPPIITTQPAYQVHYCTGCGNALSAGQVYCTCCGKRSINNG